MGQIRMEGKVEKELGVEGDNHNHYILLGKKHLFLIKENEKEGKAQEV